MSPNDPVSEMLLRWEEARSQGQTIPAETLCLECPHLLDAVRDRIEAITRMERVLGVAPADPRATLPDPTQGIAPPGDEILPDVPGYLLERILGQGGMGVVYAARQIDLGRTVALKMLSGPHLGPRALARFRGEAEAAARLQHPNVLQIYDIGQVGNRPYFSMEYVAGGNLAQLLEGSKLSPNESAELIETLARAVQHAHERGIVHRDLKPANVLLMNPQRPAGEPLLPRIADFGLAKCLDNQSNNTQTGEILGTPAYMAPEQAVGHHDVGPAADVYALGAILYECLTGRPPFQGKTPLDTLRLVTTTDPVPPSSVVAGIPLDLEAICLKCLEKEPERRYASSLALAEDLRRYRAGLPIQARRATRMQRAWKWLRRHPREVALVAALLVLASIPLLSWWREAETQRQLRVRAEAHAPLVREILQRNCAECHDQDVNGRQKNFDILNHVGLVRADRRMVLPGLPDDSRLITRIADGSMPPAEEETRLPRLSERELTLLREWIRGGAPPFPAEDPTPPTPPVEPPSPLANEVWHIFAKRCYECHKHDVAKGGIKILHHRLLVSERKVVVPGQADGSELFSLLTEPDEERRMPPGPGNQLPAAEIATIRRWIEAGAPAFTRD